MIIIFTSLVLCGSALHSGVHFWGTAALENATFHASAWLRSEKWILRSESRFFKNVQRWFLNMSGGRKTCSEAQITLPDRFHASWTDLEHFWSNLKKVQIMILEHFLTSQMYERNGFVSACDLKWHEIVSFYCNYVENHLIRSLKILFQ